MKKAIEYISFRSQGLLISLLIVCNVINANCQGCDFTVSYKNCWEVEFTAIPGDIGPGPYQYLWDFDCSGNLPIGTLSPTISHTYPCGGGQFTVCLKILIGNNFACSVTHLINVPSECCGMTIEDFVTCTEDPNVYHFNIIYHNGITPPYPFPPCIYTLISPPGATFGPGSITYTPISPSPPNNPGGVTISGNITAPCLYGPNFNFLLNATCYCGDDISSMKITCDSFLISIPTICCQKIHVNDTVICKDAPILTIPIQGLCGAALTHIKSVNWYVMNKSPSGNCPPLPWNITPYLSDLTGTLAPLTLYPYTLNSDLCIYAVVKFKDGPCDSLVSNIAMVVRCNPVQGCSLSSSVYDYCYSGTCIIPAPLTLTPILPPNACPFNIVWLHPITQLPVQTGGTTHTPGPSECLTMPYDTINCYNDFFYNVDISNPGCGTHTCSAKLRFYSDKPIGKLEINPYEGPTYCLGTDLTLVYTPNCDGIPQKWTWYTSNICDVPGPQTSLLDQGMMNPKYNTNQLYTTMFYFVESQNGVCPLKTVSLDVYVTGAPSINSFNASPDLCVDNVDLFLDFNKCRIEGCKAFCGCTYTIDWYKDDNLIGITHSISSPPATFQYSTLPLSGNYYAVLKSDCCPDSFLSSYVHIDPVCEPVIQGPCFICDNDSVTLCALMIIPPAETCSTASSCTFEWYEISTIPHIFLGSNPCINVGHGGVYQLISNCNGCIKSTQFNLVACHSASPGIPCARVSIEELLPKDANSVHIFPNPSSGEITIEWIDQAPKDTKLYITDPTGRRLRTFYVPDVTKSMNISMDDLPSGLYFVEVQSENKLLKVAKLVKE